MAKRAADRVSGMIDVSELAIGDKLRIEYSDYGNWINTDKYSGQSCDEILRDFSRISSAFSI